jgi:uncharacterized protein (DUF1697 family)
MPTYVAFLRAINLGANRKFAKDDIKRVVEAAGFTDVETHINTGNVRFTTPMRSRAKIEKKLEDAFAEDRGFDVPTIVFTTAEVAAIAAEAAELAEEHPGLARHYIYLLKDELPAATAAQVEGLASVSTPSPGAADASPGASGRVGPAGRMVVRGRAAHALLGPAYQAGQVDPLNAARLLGVATNRNRTVIAAIAEKWC